MMLYLRKMINKTVLAALLLLSSFVRSYAQESDNSFIPRTFGDIELGEYLTEQMVMDSFGLEVRYRTLNLYDITTYIIHTPVSYLGYNWNEITVDKSKDDYCTTAICFKIVLGNVSELMAKYNNMKGRFCDSWGEGTELTYALAEVTSKWEDSCTVARLSARVRDNTPEILLSFIDKLPVAPF